MGTSCQLDCSDEDDRMLDEARGFVNDLSPETYEKCKDVIEQAREDYQRAIEETERQELAEEQAAKDEANLEYQQKLQESIELKVGDHQVLIKGFNASRIDNKDTIRVQALLPSIVSQVTKEIRFTGKLPGIEMDERGKIWATVENWEHEEGKAVGRFNRHTPELTLGIEKGENELTPEEKDRLAQSQIDTQLHWNLHTIYNILFTDEDRVEVERICYEASKNNPGWEKEISPTAEKGAREGRNDEVFCEYGMKFITEVKKSFDKPTRLEKVNPEMYNLLKDRLERLSRLSDSFGLKIQGGRKNE